MILDFILWFYLVSIICLIRLTWQDTFNNMNVDDRINSFMMGVSISLAYIVHAKFLLIVLAILLFVMSKYTLKYFSRNKFGEGDQSTLLWVSFSNVFLGYLPSFVWLFYFGLSLLTYGLTKKYILKTNNHTPFMSVFLLSQCGTIITLVLAS